MSDDSGEALGEQRAAFAVPPDVAYFNCASLSPHLHAVRDAGQAALLRRGQPWTIASSDWFAEVEAVRTLFGELVGADAEGVALVPATSYGFAVAARNLRLTERDRILVLAREYPSGVYTWRAAARSSGARLVTVEREAGQSWTEAVLGVLDERITVASVPNVHWTDGALVDLDAIGVRCREVGARLVVDGSQSVGVMPLDVARVQPDFVMCVGYKWLLGPFGAGYLYVAPHQRDGEPLEQNWIVRDGAQDFTRLIDYRDDYQPGARRFDAGARTKFELLPMSIAALRQIRAWQVPRIAAALAALTSRIAHRAAELGLDTIPPDQRGPHILGITLPPEALAAIPPALAAANCYLSVRGDSLRIAPHLHITDDDITRLIAALAQALNR